MVSPDFSSFSLTALQFPDFSRSLVTLLLLESSPRKYERLLKFLAQSCEFWYIFSIFVNHKNVCN